MSKTLRTIISHQMAVRSALQTVIDKLNHRMILHDLSKFNDDEFDGFSRINAIASKYPYGSQEYKDALSQERDVIQLHYSRNSHHPEHHDDCKDMNVIDIIEMVCDWYGAWQIYDAQRPEENKQSWEQNMIIQRQRFSDMFTNGKGKEKWKVVEDIAYLLQNSTKFQ